jgi:hypothetical protein
MPVQDDTTENSKNTAVQDFEEQNKPETILPSGETRCTDRTQTFLYRTEHRKLWRNLFAMKGTNSKNTTT